MHFPYPRIALAAALLALALVPSALAQTGTETFTYNYSGNPMPIFVDDANVITLLNIDVARPTNIQDVKVTLDIEYPNPGDLNIFLYSPWGTRTKLLERNCGDSATLRGITFDDSAADRYSDACPSNAGKPMRGNEPLSNSRGEQGAGRWRLAVENNGSNDNIGWVLSFSITIKGDVVTQPVTSADLVVNSASLAQGGVAPGEIVSIFGAGLGPQTPERAPAGNLPTTLAGTEVKVNEQNAPILYVSRYRLDVQMPYALGVPGDVWITVVRNGVESAPVNLKVVKTQPGLFTVNSSGIGQLEALNSDGTPNKDQAAARGTEISVFASGLGWTVPVLPAGEAPGTKPIPVVLYPVTASIAGIEANVVAARLVQDRPGLYEVRLQIPLSVPVGVAEVKIASLASASQSGAFIRVR